MKIYFGFTVAGNRSAIEAARKIVQLLDKLGHGVLARRLVDDDKWEADRRISAQDTSPSGRLLCSLMFGKTALSVLFGSLNLSERYCQLGEFVAVSLPRTTANLLICGPGVWSSVPEKS
jgi:hypothetical protein